MQLRGVPSDQRMITINQSLMDKRNTATSLNTFDSSAKSNSNFIGLIKKEQAYSKKIQLPSSQGQKQFATNVLPPSKYSAANYKKQESYSIVYGPQFGGASHLPSINSRGSQYLKRKPFSSQGVRRINKSEPLENFDHLQNIPGLPANTLYFFMRDSRQTIELSSLPTQATPGNTIGEWNLSGKTSKKGISQFKSSSKRKNSQATNDSQVKTPVKGMQDFYPPREKVNTAQEQSINSFQTGKDSKVNNHFGPQDIRDESPEDRVFKKRQDYAETKSIKVNDPNRANKKPRYNDSVKSMNEKLKGLLLITPVEHSRKTQASTKSKNLRTSDQTQGSKQSHGSGLEFQKTIVSSDNNSPVKPVQPASQLSENVRLGDMLGEGAYGQVFKALNLLDGNFIAVKVLKVSEKKGQENVLVKLEKEISFLKHLNHKNIVRYLDSAVLNETQANIYMEYMPGGSLAGLLKQYGAFEECVIKNFTRQLLEGLKFLHENNVIHADLKGANVLFNGKSNVKLSDFGASISTKSSAFISTSQSDMCSSIKGSIFWMAPEMVKEEGYGRKIDIWALGCTIIEMASGTHPWPDVKNYAQLVYQIVEKKTPQIPEGLSQKCSDFIQSCLNYDKKLRPTAQELLEHPFITETDQ